MRLGTSRTTMTDASPDYGFGVKPHQVAFWYNRLPGRVLAMSENGSSDVAFVDRNMDRLLDAFEESLWGGLQPTIEAFCDQADATIDQRRLLIELIQVELEFRIKSGETDLVEGYLARFPDLPAIELIRAEYRLRRDLGRPTAVSHFIDRFPQYAAEIETALDHHPTTTLNATATRSDRPYDFDSSSCRPHDLGRFQMQEELGRGTYGKVYKAIDIALDRTVAIKIPRGMWLTDQENELRFFREARSVARLRHSGIVPVFEVGRDGETWFLVCEFVEGETLTSAIENRILDFCDSARLIASVADALHHAHQRGVIHRDLKPSNIMISEAGSPRVMDFGLAKRTDVDDSMSVDGQVVGTPAYMSPEQACGEAHRVDGRSDVYGLGVILYQLLTGELPFRGNDRMLLRQVIHNDPRPPRSLNDRVPPDLETICLKCMAKEPERRYQNAEELAADLRRWIHGEPIEARPTSAVFKTWSWAKRNRRTTALAVSTAILLIAISVVSTVSAIAVSRIAEKERNTAVAAMAAESKAEAAMIDAKRERDAAEVARAKALGEQQIASHVSDFLVGLFQASDPIGLGGFGLHQNRETPDEPTVANLLDLATKRIRGELIQEPLVRAKLMATLANVHRSRGDFEQAQSLIADAESLWLEHGGDELGGSRIRFVSAWLKHDLGQFEQAKVLYEEILSTQKRILGPEHLETATTMFNYGWLLEDMIVTLNNRHPPQVNTSELFREVLRIRRTQLGEGHRDVAVAMTGLLVVLIGSDRQDEVESLLLDAVKIYQSQVDGQQLGMAVSLFVTGNLARKNGRLSKSITDYQKGVAIAKQILGDRHPLVGIALGELAGTCKQAGQFEQAEAAVLESLDIARDVTRNGHPSMVSPLVELSEWRFNHRQFDDCERLDREAIKVFRNFPNSHQGSAYEAMLRLASLCFARAEFEEARCLYQEVADSGVPDGRGSDWTYPQEARIGLARVLHAQGQIDSAVERYELIFERDFHRSYSVASHTAVDRLHAMTLSGWAGAICDQQKRDAQIGGNRVKQSQDERILKFLESSQHFDRNIDWRDEVAIAEILSEAARLQLADGNVRLAIDNAQRAQQILGQRLPEGSWIIAAARCCYGSCLIADGQFAQAETVLLESHQALESMLGESHFRTTEAREHLIHLYTQWDKPEQAALFQANPERLAP